MRMLFVSRQCWQEILAVWMKRSHWTIVPSNWTLCGPQRISNLGIHFYYAGKFKEAEAAFRKTLELAPQRPGAHSRLGLVYLLQSQSEKALAEFQKEPVPFWRQQGLALYYHATGNKKEADSTLDECIKEFQNDAAFQVAEIYAYRGESDKAFEWLERAYEHTRRWPCRNEGWIPCFAICIRIHAGQRS